MAEKKTNKQSKRPKTAQPLEQLLAGFFANTNQHPSNHKLIRLALKHLDAQGIRTHKQLISRLESLPAKLRRESIYVLQEIGRKSDVALLTRMMRTDKSLRVRAWAIDALGWIGGARAAQALEKMVLDLGQPDRLRWGCVYQLSFERPHQKLELFATLAADPGEHPMIRGQAAEGIANGSHADRRRLAFKRAEQVMLDCLNDPHGSVRFWAMFALSGFKSKKALPKLRRLAKSDHFVGTMGWKNSEEAKDSIEIISGRDPEPDASQRLGQRRLKPDYAWPWAF